MNEVKRLENEIKQKKIQTLETIQFNPAYKLVNEGVKKSDIANVNQRYSYIEFNPKYLKRFGVNDLYSLINDLVKVYIHRNKLSENDMIALEVKSRDANRATPRFKLKDFDPADVLSYIQNVINSDESIELKDFEYIIKSYKMPSGGRGMKVMNVDDDLKKKRCIITIKNTDDLCLARCLVVATNKNHPQYFQIKNGRGPRQTELAIQLHQQTNIPLTLCTIEDVIVFEHFLKKRIIMVAVNKSFIYKGNSEYNDHIYVLYHNNHYDLITNITAYLCKTYYCTNCLKGYNNSHTCDNACNICKTLGCSGMSNLSKWLKCEDCNRSFPSEQCFSNHLENCSEKFKCLSCKITMKTKYKDKHKCNYSVCRICSQYVETKKHLCYLQKPKPKPYTKTIYFDFEARQETGKHIVNLAVAVKDGVFSTFYDINEFCKWLIKKEHFGYTIIAHNGRGYDFQFILEWLLLNGHTPFTIRSGSKLMFMSVGHGKSSIKFVDSLNFLQMALKDFPKTFNIKELKKGYFPHFFNKKCNENYIGPLPAKRHYGYNQMKTKDREQFLKWYEENQNKTFDMKSEILEYCKSDVLLLREGCEKLKEIFIENTKTDPFAFATIASCCMYIFRLNYMEENSIAVLKQEKEDTHSKISIKWLYYLEKTKNIKITHALNGKEKCIGKYRVDGYDPITKTAYEFNGCYFHGCPKDFDNLEAKKKYQKTMEKKKFIISKGYNYVDIWECDWKKQLQNQEVKKILKTFKQKVIEKINISDSFYGGRTNATKLYYKCRENEEIHYADFTSLYSWVNFYCIYPKGHPTILKDIKINEIDKIFGFIKCKILPPKMLYHPVLPLKLTTNKFEKLVFPLCYTCAITNSNKCNHNDEDRALIGTWTSMEIDKAIQKGYKVLEAYEAVHFDEVTTNLFKSYVEFFMKIKQENSKLPDWVKTDDDRQKYVDDYYKRQGIKLDIEKCNGENAGMRTMAKLCLNSLWGKFGQASNKTQTVFINNEADFYKYATDDKIDQFNFNVIDENTIEINYNLKADLVEDPMNTNVAIASFTTAYGRLKLYDELDRLGEQVLYFDTDGLVYVYDKANPKHIKLKTGELLGDLTDELDGNYITEFCSTGPKSYAYKLDDGTAKCKVKGFSLNYYNSGFINFESMKEMIFSLYPTDDTAKRGMKKEVVIVNENMIKRDNRQIFSVYSEKLYKVDYDKRCVGKFNGYSINTLPFGSVY
jgi:hypothetical protein